jgi:mono/diheme cytochrome c family protein
VTTTTIAIGILALAGLAVAALLFLVGRRPRRSLEDVPPGMRPGYSDEELEKSVIERYMGWGVVLVLFFAIFFPAYFLYDTQFRLNQAQQDFFVTGVVEGEEEYQLLCAQCHGAEGQGGAAAAPDDPDSSWPAPQLNNIVARYEDNLNVDDIEDFIYTTIERGRPGTPMPVFGQAFGGPLTDAEVQHITDWILDNQIEEDVAEADAAFGQSGEELYAGNCMKCHGADLEGGVGPPLVGVFERHSEEQILAILRHGIIVPTGAIMPPWQEGYMYTDARYDDPALERIVEYLRDAQPDDPADVEIDADAVPQPDDDALEGDVEEPDDDGDEDDDNGDDENDDLETARA